MRFTLKSLILAVLLIGAVPALWVGLYGKRNHPSYQGYFSHHQQIQHLINRVDPAVKIQGSGGGGGGGEEFAIHYSHSLTSDRPISENLINGIRRLLHEDLRARGINVLVEKDANGGDSSYPVAGVQLTTWGFQMGFEEKGHKGVVIVQLTSKSIRGVESLGHIADLRENIVVFRKD